MQFSILIFFGLIACGNASTFCENLWNVNCTNSAQEIYLSIGRALQLQASQNKSGIQHIPTEQKTLSVTDAAVCFDINQKKDCDAKSNCLWSNDNCILKSMEPVFSRKKSYDGKIDALISGLTLNKIMTCLMEPKCENAECFVSTDNLSLYGLRYNSRTASPCIPKEFESNIDLLTVPVGAKNFLEISADPVIDSAASDPVLITLDSAHASTTDVPALVPFLSPVIRDPPGAIARGLPAAPNPVTSDYLFSEAKKVMYNGTSVIDALCVELWGAPCKNAAQLLILSMSTQWYTSYKKDLAISQSGEHKTLPFSDGSQCFSATTETDCKRIMTTSGLSCGWCSNAKTCIASSLKDFCSSDIDKLARVYTPPASGSSPLTAIGIIKCLSTTAKCDGECSLPIKSDLKIRDVYGIRPYSAQLCLPSEYSDKLNADLADIPENAFSILNPKRSNTASHHAIMAIISSLLILHSFF